MINSDELWFTEKCSQNYMTYTEAETDNFLDYVGNLVTYGGITLNKAREEGYNFVFGLTHAD